MNEHLLDIRNLKTWYRTYRATPGCRRHQSQHRPGKKIGIVGESGCGKTTTMKSVLRVLDERKAYLPEGEILFRNQNILAMKEPELQQIRRRSISMISQEPRRLESRFTVGSRCSMSSHIRNRAARVRKKRITDMAIKAVRDVFIPDPSGYCSVTRTSSAEE